MVFDLAHHKKPVSIARGTGRHLTGVNLTEGGDVLGVRLGHNPAAAHPDDTSDGPWLRFDLNRFVPSKDNAKWVDPVAESAGWTIVPDRDRTVWFAERQGVDGSKEKLRLGLDSYLDVNPTCYTFLPTPKGRPTRVLIGHYYGCSLFELAPGRVVKNQVTGVMELPRSKLFIGHGGEVTSVVEENAGQLIVAKVDVGSPAYEAGLTKGDTIKLLAINGKRFYDRRDGQTPLGTVEATVEALQRPQSGVELFFGWISAQGDYRGTNTRLKQRPLWKWFPAFDDQNRMTDSIIWMWFGSYYYTASVHGDRMLGWHLNDANVDGTPAFHPLERFKHLFLKPDTIAKLIATRSVEEALKDAQDGNPQKRMFRDVEPAPVSLALKQGVVRGDPVTVTVAVNPQGNDPDLLPSRVELWLNDHRIKTWEGRGKQALQADVKIPGSAFRSGDNQLTVLAMNPARGRAEQTRFIANPVTPTEVDLHGVVVGINDYSSHRKAVNGVRAFGDLGKARADAEGFQEVLLNYRGPGKCFPKGYLELLVDARADRKTILDGLAEFKGSGVKPNDLLVVFFAGHGDLLTPNGKAPLDVVAGRGFTADTGLFVFCCPNYIPSKAAATALSGEQLFEALAEINCRKLVLLDTCHAGGAVEANLLRRFIPNGQGPFVIAACDQSESSFEDDKLGHGVFTYAVLEALDKKFRKANVNSDGKLTPKELFDYVSERVPALMREVKPGNTQNPICFPHPDNLPKTVLLSR
jgi:hypothetical protein